VEIMGFKVQAAEAEDCPHRSCRPLAAEPAGAAEPAVGLVPRQAGKVGV